MYIEKVFKLKLKPDEAEVLKKCEALLNISSFPFQTKMETGLRSQHRSEHHNPSTL